MIRIALAQLNLPVGDIDGNAARIEHELAEAEQAGAQVVAFPELAITGYPPEDLLLKRSFVDANVRAAERVAATSGRALAIFGFVDRGHGSLYNAAAICQGGRILAVYRKHLLPNYGVFDERRYFDEGRGHFLFDTGKGVIGVCICEDAWSETGPVTRQGDAGAQVIVNINASPFHKDKIGSRFALLRERAERAKAAIAYVNMIGGQDELVFDGGSLAVGADGALLARLPQFRETVALVDVPPGAGGARKHPAITRMSVELPETHGDLQRVEERDPPATEEVYRALKLALADYASKNRFTKVVIGLSGGVDSALTAVIAADALGPDSVLGVAMPSEFSSSHSVDDAKALAENLGIQMLQIPIARTYHAYLESLEAAFGPEEMGLAEENVQARIRGNILMAISNRYGHLLLATGNKSEMACGYATLYGDMAGGFALLKDVFKTEVYDLCRYRNGISPVIPDNILIKPPSAELRPDQKDSDSLPPYDVLDPILEAYIENDAGIADIEAMGFDRSTVEKVIALVDRAEYKRRQAPPGPKVTTKAFGRDRRLPISSRWREGDVAPLPARVVGEGKALGD
ncbi:MAG: NAD+ synthase [Actinomycetota bacterium]|nr:NAD+ synthase [Actinomycetota bacterium]